MSVSSENGTVHLSGRCPAEDAEDLLRALRERPDAVVDISEVRRVHMAVMQVLLALRPAMRGRPSAGMFSQPIWLRMISDDDTAEKNP